MERLLCISRVGRNGNGFRQWCITKATRALLIIIIGSAFERSKEERVERLCTLAGLGVMGMVSTVVYNKGHSRFAYYYYHWFCFRMKQGRTGGKALYIGRVGRNGNAFDSGI